MRSIADGVMRINEGDLRTVRVASDGTTIETTIAGPNKAVTVPTAERSVRAYVARIQEAEQAVAYACRPIVSDPKQPTPMPLAEIAEDDPDRPMLCPICGTEPFARCTLCHGDGEVTAATALGWLTRGKAASEIRDA